MNYITLILKYIRPILIGVATFFGIILIYKNYKKITQFFTDKATNLSADETPTSQELNNPTYEISDKVIENYVSDIIIAVDGFGTDEQALDRIYKHLKNSSKKNTVKLWNAFKNRHLKYNRVTGTFYNVPLGDEMTLYQVFRSELTNTQSEKNALTNWTWLFKKHGLI